MPSWALSDRWDWRTRSPGPGWPGYIPSIIGALLNVGGAGFFLRNATFLVAPSISSDIMLLPMALGGIPPMLWLLIRGVGRSGGSPNRAQFATLDASPR